MVHFNTLKRSGWLLLILAVSACGDRPDKLMASARQYIGKHDYRAAVIQLKNVLQADPNVAEARYLLGVSLLKISDPTAAEQELRRAQELHHPPDKTSPPLAQALLEQGKTEAVISEFSSTVLTDLGAQAELRVHVANALLASGKLDEAQEILAAVTVAQPENLAARIAQARSFAMKGNPQGAQRIVDEVLATDPKQVDALLLSADLASSEGRADVAIDQLKRVVQVTPDNMINRVRLALALLQHGNLDQEAAQQIESIKKIAPRDPRTLYLQSLLAFKRGNFSDARGFAQQALKGAPEYVPALVVAGETSLRLGAYNQAQDYLNQALQLSPDHRYAQRLLATAYLRAGDLGRASRLVDVSLKQTPDDASLLGLAAEVALAKNDLEAASRYYEKSTKADSRNVVAASRLAQIRFAEGDANEALKILEAGSASSENQYQADLMLALYYGQHGQFDKASTWIDKIEKKQPSNPVGPTLRAALYAARNDYKAARLQYEHALELQSDFVPALEGLARLDIRDNALSAARTRFEAVLKKEPKNEAVAMGYVRFLTAARADNADVIRVLENTLRNEPSARQARIELVAAYLNANDATKALAVAQEGLAAAATENPTLQALIGRAYQGVGDRTQAVATFEQLVSKAPKDPQRLLLLADAYYASGDRQKALDTLQNALHIQPDLIPAQLAMIRLYVEGGHTDQATAVARRIFEKQAKQTVGYELAAANFAQLQRWDEAVKVLEDGLRQSGAPNLAVKLHSALVGAGRKPDADAFAAKWIRDHPGDPVVRTYLGEQAVIAKDFPAAARYYRQLVSIQPKNGHAFNNLAYVASQMNDPKAQDYAEEANRLLPDYAPIMDTLGWLVVNKGDLARGQDLLSKAAALAPQSMEIRLHLAKARIKAGQKDEARKELEQIVKEPEQGGQRAEAEALLRSL